MLCSVLELHRRGGVWPMEVLRVQPLFLMLTFYCFRSKWFLHPLDQINLILNQSSSISFLHFLNGYLLNMARAESALQVTKQGRSKEMPPGDVCMVKYPRNQTNRGSQVQKKMTSLRDRQDRFHTFNEALCDRQNNVTPRDVHVLIPRSYESVR